MSKAETQRLARRYERKHAALAALQKSLLHPSLHRGAVRAATWHWEWRVAAAIGNKRAAHFSSPGGRVACGMVKNDGHSPPLRALMNP